MTPAYFYIALAAAPIATLSVVLVGYIVQNQNLNARMAELRTDLGSRMGEMRGEITNRFNDTNARIASELAAVRAEMTRNHSELVHKFADLDTRLTKLEHR